jgi:hypothetical protein
MDEIRVKAIHALWLSALSLGNVCVATAQSDDDHPLFDLWYESSRPVTGREDPKLLAATARKILELASQQFIGRPLTIVTCLGLGDACADPSAELVSRLARVHASFFFDADSGAGWRCDATRMGAQWVVGPCRLMWSL